MASNAAAPVVKPCRPGNHAAENPLRPSPIQWIGMALAR